MRKYSFILLTLASTTALALPPNAAPGLVPGANHHTGDVGFVATYGREPHAGEEKQRMHEHFVAVRARLAKGHAPTPALEAKRQQLLGFLDQYIAKGTTPENGHLPWRTPVFIDDDHTICAVGYLIQESAGRAVAEKIAKSHRYSFIEDIAKDMPEVQEWVAQSGFTLDELGQIQPGYMGPDVLQWQHWNLAKNEGLGTAKGGDYNSSPLAADGRFETDTITGKIMKHHMDGAWQVSTVAGPDVEGVDNKAPVVVGNGVMKRGRGEWTALYASGNPLAKGNYVRDLPSGPWQIFHESGNLAAEGNFSAGQRTGTWRFYYDTPDKTPIAAGAFSAGGNVSGTWKHYDARGALLATSSVDTPVQWEKRGKNQLFWSVGYLLDVKPSPNGIHHRIHQGSLDGQQVRLDELTDGKERIYMVGDTVYDTGGHELVSVDGGWLAQDCSWTKGEKRAAANADIAALHGAMVDYNDEHSGDDAKDKCVDGKRAFISAARATRVTALVFSMQEVRQATPQFITGITLGGDPDEKVKDLPDTLAASMSLDIEWPHVDGKFAELYKVLPGYRR